MFFRELVIISARHMWRVLALAKDEVLREPEQHRGYTVEPLKV
jgi:hypothetical protein